MEQSRQEHIQQVQQYWITTTSDYIKQTGQPVKSLIEDLSTMIFNTITEEIPEWKYNSHFEIPEFRATLRGYKEWKKVLNTGDTEGGILTFYQCDYLYVQVLQKDRYDRNDDGDEWKKQIDELLELTPRNYRNFDHFLSGMFI